MSINLGYVPQALTVTLVRGSAFVSSLLAATPWPPSTVITLVLGAVTWTATINGASATWDRPPADVAAVLDAGTRTAVLTYTSSGGEAVTWAKGPVNAL